MKQKLYIVFICIILVGFFIFYQKPKETKVVSINDTKISVILATNQETWEKGLSGTKPLKDHEGMLFIFPESAPYEFWMKDMNYPIDIIWFDENLRIITIKENVDPSSYPQTFVPDAPSRYVLEVKSGTSSKYNFKKNDQLFVE